MRKLAELTITNRSPITHIEWRGDSQWLIVSSVMPKVFAIDLDPVSGPAQPYLQELFAIEEDENLGPQGTIGTYQIGMRIITATYRGVIELHSIQSETDKSPALLQRRKLGVPILYFHASNQTAAVILPNKAITFFALQDDCLIERTLTLKVEIPSFL